MISDNRINSTNSLDINERDQTIDLEEPSATPVPEFTASFEIYTFGTRRTFSDSRYHELSDNVYIPSEYPDTVIVKDSTVTWSDLFETLPMSLDSECLITGTGQTFCSEKNNQLTFYLNDVVDDNALDRRIEKDDKLRVVYE